MGETLVKSLRKKSTHLPLLILDAANTSFQLYHIGIRATKVFNLALLPMRRAPKTAAFA